MSIDHWPPTKEEMERAMELYNKMSPDSLKESTNPLPKADIRKMFKNKKEEAV